MVRTLPVAVLAIVALLAADLILADSKDGPVIGRVNVLVEKDGKIVTESRDVHREDAETALRSRLVELMKRKAGQMSLVELQERIQQLELELAERNQEADASLQTAIEALELTACDYAGTQAADRAEAALDILSGPSAVLPISPSGKVDPIHESSPEEP